VGRRPSNPETAFAGSSSRHPRQRDHHATKQSTAVDCFVATEGTGSGFVAAPDSRCELTTKKVTAVESFVAIARRLAMGRGWSVGGP
jgi:hypothetical protein